MIMKMTKIFLGLALSACCVLVSAQDSTIPAPKKGSPEFEQLKTLVGTWKGTADFGQGPAEFTMQYRLIANGSVLEERSMVGTPMEMVTMYYEKEGKLTLTHYCVLGNQPGMVVKSFKGNELRFDLDKNCEAQLANQMHMHALGIRFDDANTITTTCESMNAGVKSETKPTVLKRVNP